MESHTIKVNDGGGEIAFSMDEGLYDLIPTVRNIKNGHFGVKGEKEHRMK